MKNKIKEIAIKILISFAVLAIAELFDQTVRFIDIILLLLLIDISVELNFEFEEETEEQE